MWLGVFAHTDLVDVSVEGVALVPPALGQTQVPVQQDLHTPRGQAHNRTLITAVKLQLDSNIETKR